MTIQLVPGASADDALRGIEYEIGNMSSASTFVLPHEAAARSESVRDRYVKWCIDVETRLSAVLSKPQVQELIQTSRHSDICAMGPSEQLIRSVNAEITTKRENLTALSSELRKFADLLSRASGVPAILDTNVLIQCVRLDQIDWPAITGGVSRLIIPLRVLEELDAKKIDKKPRLNKTAREILSWLDEQFDDATTGPITIRGTRDTTLEILLASRPRIRPMDPDEEILEVCHDLGRYLSDLVLVTADNAMRLRARSESIEVRTIPEKYLRFTG